VVAPRLTELPFSSERKRMTTVHRMPDGRRLAFTKGAPEAVLAACATEWRDGVPRPMDEPARAAILAASEKMAGEALRVLAVAFRELDRDVDDESLESDLAFVGLVGMMDPPRPEAIEAVKTCRRVHIRPVMITGDHRLTAVAIATETGIYSPGDRVLTGEELARMDEAELERVVTDVSVYARVSPTDKLKIVRAWKKRGHVVAMTGDGVNDAPALKHADIGIAMGITGTDVAKEAADMVLADDNFATIVKAIERGRWIYDNIRKYLTYLLRANVTEVLVLGGVVIVSGPELLPLLPAAILYINLASDGLPALALGLAPPDRDIMKRPPRDPKESIFSADVRLLVLLGVLIETPLLLWVFMENAWDLEVARTRIFLLFVFIEMIIALCFRSLRYSVFEAPPHKWLVLAVTWELALLAVLLQIPAVRETFGIRMPTGADLAVALGVAAVVAASIEICKAYLKGRGQGAEVASAHPGQPAIAASTPWGPRGGTAMRRVLIPVDRSRNCRLAVRQAIAEYANNKSLEIHLVNVQPAFSRHIAQFVSRRNLETFHRAEARKALDPCTAMLERMGVPHKAHVEVGDRAHCITALAKRLGCDLILMSSARKNSLTRLVEDSVTSHVLELAEMPVEVIPGDDVSGWERFGIPAALAGGAAAAVFAIVD
jgi:Ca2+-transporting ATPase